MSLRPQIRPALALTHPLWWIALGVLALNDHVLKYSAFAGDVTGKLSDFAGLIVAPVLVATMLRVRSERGLWSVSAAIGAVFGGINLSPALAATFDNLISNLVPFYTTPDPTDLMALIAIPVGILAFREQMKREHVASRAVQGAAVALGGIACMATSPEPSCDDCEPWEFTMWSQVSVLNRTNELIVLRLRELDPNVSMDCDVVATDPPAYLNSSYFGPTTRWLVQSGQEIPVAQDTGESSKCRAVRIESDMVPDIVVFWGDDIPFKSYRYDAPDVPVSIPPDLNTLTIEAEYAGEELHAFGERSECGSTLDWCDESTYAYLAEIPVGARYTWGARSEARLFWPLPVLDTPASQPGEDCAMPGPGEALFWDDASGNDTIVAASFSPDGCADYTLASGAHWYACGPIEALQALDPKDGPLDARFEPTTQVSSGFSGGLDSMVVSLTSAEGTEYRRVIFTRGYGLPGSVGYHWEANIRTDCKPLPDYCNTPVIPADVTMRGQQLATGVPTQVDGQATAILVRSFNVPVRDLRCESLSLLLPELDLDDESVYLEMAFVLE